MANEQNLTHKLTVNEQRKGGQSSGRTRRERKTVQNILTELLETPIKDMPQFRKVASKLGIESEKNVKYIFTLVCLMNSLKSGDLNDLDKLVRLLGEEAIVEKPVEAQDELSLALQEFAKELKKNDK